MKYLKTILLFLLVTTVLSAQDYHTIELLPNETETVENVDFYVSGIIDNRAYKNNIGIAQKGAFNRKVLSQFSKEFDKELLDYLVTVFPKEENKTPLVLRINQLLILEKTGAFKETGKAIVNLDVLKKQGDTYVLLGSYTSKKEKNSMDVTRKHDDRIRATLKDCLMKYNDTDPSQIINKPITLITQSKPVIFDEPIAKGFFVSFLELYNNQSFSDSTIQFKDNKHRTNKLFLKDREHKRAMYYAFSDGEDIYLNASNYSGEKHFVKTKRVDDFLLFNDNFIHADDVGGMTLAFGVLGTLASNKNTNVLLDLTSGQYHNISISKIKLLLKKEHPDLFKKYKGENNNTENVFEVFAELYKRSDRNFVNDIIKSE